MLKHNTNFVFGDFLLFQILCVSAGVSLLIQETIAGMSRSWTSTVRLIPDKSDSSFIYIYTNELQTELYFTENILVFILANLNPARDLTGKQPAKTLSTLSTCICCNHYTSKGVIRTTVIDKRVSERAVPALSKKFVGSL